MGAKKESNKEFGAKAVAELLNNVDASTRERLLLKLAEKDPAAHARVQDRMFTFEEVAKLPDDKIRELLKRVPQTQMALALRKASPELKATLFRNMPKSAVESLTNLIDQIGPQRLVLVETAQQEIANVAKTLR